MFYRDTSVSGLLQLLDTYFLFDLQNLQPCAMNPAHVLSLVIPTPSTTRSHHNAELFHNDSKDQRDWIISRPSVEFSYPPKELCISIAIRMTHLRTRREPLMFVMQQEGKKITGSAIHRLIGLKAEEQLRPNLTFLAPSSVHEQGRYIVRSMSPHTSDNEAGRATRGRQSRL